MRKFVYHYWLLILLAGLALVAALAALASGGQ